MGSNLIECDGKIGLKTSPIDRVHVIGGTLVHTSVHLGGRIDFNLRFYLVLSNVPLVDMQVKVAENLDAILEPGYLWPRCATCYTQESDFVPKYVFIVEV